MIITFKFELNQLVNIPGGTGWIEGAAVFWRPDGGQEVRYWIIGVGWLTEAELLEKNAAVDINPEV